MKQSDIIAQQIAELSALHTVTLENEQHAEKRDENHKRALENEKAKYVLWENGFSEDAIDRIVGGLVTIDKPVTKKKARKKTVSKKTVSNSRYHYHQKIATDKIVKAKSPREFGTTLQLVLAYAYRNGLDTKKYDKWSKKTMRASETCSTANSKFNMPEHRQKYINGENGAKQYIDTYGQQIENETFKL